MPGALGLVSRLSSEAAIGSPLVKINMIYPMRSAGVDWPFVILVGSSGRLIWSADCASSPGVLATNLLILFTFALPPLASLASI